MKKLLKTTLAFVVCVLLLTSCRAKKRMNRDFNYFQRGFDSTAVIKYVEPTFKESDVITVQIIAGAIRQDDANVFNLSNGALGNIGLTNAQGYQVGLDGTIELPKIGKVKAIGLNKYQLAESIQKLLIDEVKNPLVIVRYGQFKVSVLGEVRRPGTTTLKNDKTNIIDAIAEAGDLTEYGKREDIMLIRKIDGKYEHYRIDLRSAAIFGSKEFQVLPDDIIYVGTNDVKLKSLAINPNFQRDISLLLSSVSVLLVLINTLRTFK